MADGQLSELIELLSTRDEAALGVPCPGREKLGDGTVAACASHTAENYLRIAAFLRDEDHPHVAHGHSAPHDAKDVDRQSPLERLSAGRDAFGALSGLTDEQLDSVPPASDMKFCDGQRTVEQIVTNLLNHQSHRLDALRAALA
jgi:hypothetical protein